MKPKRLDIDVADEDTDGLANDVNASSGNPFTLAATAPTDGLAHKIVITPSGSVTGNYTLTGTDADSKAATETLATDTTNAVTSAKFYKTLTEVLAPSGIGAETVDIGWADEVSTQTIPLDYRANTPAAVQVVVTGTINYDVEGTLSDVQLMGAAAPFAFDEQADFSWLNDANFTGKTASLADDVALAGLRAIRIVVNSYSSGAELQVFITQPSND